MYDYVVNELPELVEANFPLTDKRAISGHSMGGHGALTIGLKHPDRYSSISAFSPICNPSQCDWGKKAFSNYLGGDRESWLEYDSTELISKADQQLPIRIDQGDADEFLAEQLLPDNLLVAAKETNYPVDYHLHAGYDHSYFFIASFIEAQLRFHQHYLQAV